MSKALFHKRLRLWYDLHGRKDLPWRKTSDAYRIYVSEVMLQQTQVKTVLERFYSPFLLQFPTLSSIAIASQNDILSAWQGLGYYSRALNLQKTAIASGGILPDTLEGLMALPGIGRNTAHAILALAHHKPYAVMEANVRRVLCRIFAIETLNEADLWAKASQLLDVDAPFDYNQAMMDLGALVCTKRQPNCSHCPANILCEGKNSPELYPAAKRKKQVPVRRETIWVLQNQRGEYYSIARKTRFLEGLYQFIQTEHQDEMIVISGVEYHREDGIHIGHFSQQYSHFTLEADVVCLKSCKSKGCDWFAARDLVSLPMSMAEKKVLSLLGLKSR